MQLAGRVSDLMRYGAGAGEDPFAKVKALITDMVRRLEREAGIEATHKAYCDKEMGTTQDKIDNLKGTLEVLKAKVDKKKVIICAAEGRHQRTAASACKVGKVAG